MVSIHTPARGTTKVTLGIPGMAKAFQSTPPMQGATIHWIQKIRKIWFQSTPPMQGATAYQAKRHKRFNVSIHAPYAGSDKNRKYMLQVETGFNPRPLCRERQGSQRERYQMNEFQSTPPMQGATLYRRACTA